MASKNIDFDADKQSLYQELGMEMGNLFVDNVTMCLLHSDDDNFQRKRRANYKRRIVSFSSSGNQAEISHMNSRQDAFI